MIESQEHLDRLTSRIRHRFGRSILYYTDRQELDSIIHYSIFGAMRVFDGTRLTAKSNTDEYLVAKGFFLAIEELRKLGVLRRYTKTHWPRFVNIGHLDELPDKPWKRLVLNWARLTSGLSITAKYVLHCVFYLGLEQREVADLLGVSRPAICMRLKKLCSKLRKRWEGRLDEIATWALVA